MSKFRHSKAMTIIARFIDKRSKKKRKGISMAFIFDERIPIQYRLVYLTCSEQEKQEIIDAYKQDLKNNIFENG